MLSVREKGVGFGGWGVVIVLAYLQRTEWGLYSMQMMFALELLFSQSFHIYNLYNVNGGIVKTCYFLV